MRRMTLRWGGGGWPGSRGEGGGGWPGSRGEGEGVARLHTKRTQLSTVQTHEQRCQLWRMKITFSMQTLGTSAIV